MNRVFDIPQPFRVPDGTLVSPFLNSKDSNSGLPFDLIDGFSIAAGTIEPRSKSKIHVMPFCAQVTFVLRGRLVVRMKAATDKAPYSCDVQPHQAILTEPASLLQLVNESDTVCEVLYIVSPAYVFEKTNGQVVYDDSVVLDDDWSQLDALGWRLGKQTPTLEERRAATDRLRLRLPR